MIHVVTYYPGIVSFTVCHPEVVYKPLTYLTKFSLSLDRGREFLEFQVLLLSILTVIRLVLLSVLAASEWK